jgi:hypothetical protein
MAGWSEVGGHRGRRHVGSICEPHMLGPCQNQGKLWREDVYTVWSVRRGMMSDFVNRGGKADFCDRRGMQNGLIP